MLEDRFAVTGIIGQGGMGWVYRAFDHIDQREVALKVLRPTHYDDTVTRMRFESEGRILQQLDHPNLVQVYGYGTFALMGEKYPYIVMELLRGRPLSSLIAHPESLDTRVILAISRGVAAAMAHVHSAGIIHRDIKPDNILLVPDENEGERVKVVDFGIARFESAVALTRTGMLIGTPQYMSPEQAMPGQVVGPPADVYSFGVVLYRMLTGRLPFTGESVLQLMMMHAYRPIPELVLREGLNVPAALVELCQQCLDKHPVNRPLDGHAVIEALARIDGSHNANGKAQNPTSLEVPTSPTLNRRQDSPTKIHQAGKFFSSNLEHELEYASQEAFRIIAQVLEHHDWLCLEPDSDENLSISSKAAAGFAPAGLVCRSLQALEFEQLWFRSKLRPEELHRFVTQLASSDEQRDSEAFLDEWLDDGQRGLAIAKPLLPALDAPATELFPELAPFVRTLMTPKVDIGYREGFEPFRAPPIFSETRQQMAIMTDEMKWEDAHALRRQMSNVLLAATTVSQPSLTERECARLLCRMVIEHGKSNEWNDVTQLVRNLLHMSQAESGITRFARESAASAIRLLQSPGVLRNLAELETPPSPEFVRWVLGSDPLVTWDLVVPPQTPDAEVELATRFFRICYPADHPFWARLVEKLDPSRAQCIQENLTEPEAQAAGPSAFSPTKTRPDLATPGTISQLEAERAFTLLDQLARSALSVGEHTVTQRSRRY
jgi:serine/threonine protein kinase